MAKTWEYLKDRFIPTLVVMIVAGTASTFLSFKIAEYRIDSIEEELSKKASWGSVEVTRSMNDNRMNRIEIELQKKASKEMVNLMYDDIKEMKKDIKELLKSKGS